MKIIRIALIALLLIILIWVDLPENTHVKFSIGPVKVDQVINPLVIDATVFGQPIRREFKTRLGLDLRGGSQLIFEADTSRVKAADLKDAVDSSRDIIEKRVNLYGVSEPVVQTVKSGKVYRITVSLPGITNVAQAVALIGKTAQLSFKEQSTVEQKLIASGSGTIALPSKDTGMSGKHIKKASVTFNSQNGEPEVSLEFTPEGKKLFAEITRRNVGKPVGIYIDKSLLSAPVVQQEIADGNAVITGKFTTDAAKNLVVSINSGALPVPLRLIQQQQIGPSLGRVEVQKSVIAGIIGLAMVLIFMIGYYGRLGVVAAIALIIYGLITLALFRAIPIVLTLPGVAGFLLSIGMAVDTNILIFERIKEELRKGRSFDVAFKLGFGRAMDAIKDANLTTLFVAFILFNPLNWEFLPQFGLIRGFAATLIVGVLTSLFTGVVITKRLIPLFYKQKA